MKRVISKNMIIGGILVLSVFWGTFWIIRQHNAETE